MKSSKSIIPLDPISDYMMAIESDDYPKTDITQMQFRGKIDFAALAEAYQEALKHVPLFSSHLCEVRRGWRYFPHWVYDKETPNRLKAVDCRHMVKQPFDPMEFTTEYYAANIRQRINLGREFPFRASLLRIYDDTYLFSMVYHHSIFDGAKAYRVWTKMLSSYHEKVKGRKPDWANSLGMAALRRREGLIKPVSRLKFFCEQLGDVWVRNRAGVVSHIATESIRDYRLVKGRHSIRAVIGDPLLQKGLFDRAKRNRATFNDLVYAVVLKTLAGWNEDRGVSSERFRFMLVTSLKGRMELPADVGAGLSFLNIVCADRQKNDLDSLIRYYRDYKKRQLAEGSDILLFHSLCELVRRLRMLPITLRHKVIQPISNSFPVTFYLSNVGVVWPRFENGRPTMDSEILGAGDFEINDLHSSVSLGRSMGLGLTIRTHNHRLNFNFVADRFRFKKHEAQTLVDKIMNNINNAA